MTSTHSASDTITDNELQSLQELEAAPSGEPVVRFIQQCQDWFEGWLEANKHPLENGEISSDQVLMFVFAEAPDIERETFAPLVMQWTRFFPRAYDQSAQGVVLSNENFRTMYRIRGSIASLNDAFELISDHLQAFHTFALAQLSQRRLLFHLPGGSIENWCADPTGNQIRASTEALSASRIENDVQQFHNESLLYATNPIAQQIWKGKQYPYELQTNPEQRIQSYLHLYLHASYKHLSGIVDEEVRGKGGRCDIRVTWPSPPGSAFKHITTMLELKVLVEGKGATYHRTWALSGIEQAHKYRRENSEAVYACIFDARKDKANQMLDLDEIAIENDVRLKRYLMEAPIDEKAATPTSKAAKKGAKRATKTPAKSTNKTARKPKKAGSAK
jgi:hypothetical protein